MHCTRDHHIRNRADIHVSPLLERRHPRECDSHPEIAAFSVSLNQGAIRGHSVSYGQ